MELIETPSIKIKLNNERHLQSNRDMAYSINRTEHEYHSESELPYLDEHSNSIQYLPLYVNLEYDTDNENSLDAVIDKRKIQISLPIQEISNVSGSSTNICTRIKNQYSIEDSKQTKCMKKGKKIDGIKNVDEKLHVCIICNNSFTRPGHLKRHMKVHTGQKDFECHYCNKGYITKDRLRTHIRKHITESLNIIKPGFECVFCSKTFTEKRYHTRHLKIHTAKKSYICKVCDRGFARSYHLNRHIKVHSGQKDYQCHLCEKKYTTNRYLQMHLYMHPEINTHLDNNFKFECIFCKKRFPFSISLTRHMKTHSTKPHNCKICDRSFMVKRYLTLHERRHVGQKNYECDYCNKRFAAKAKLKYHIRMHTGDRPYTCEICSYKFFGIGALNDHKKMHKMPHCYECDKCSKKFTRRYSLKKHLKLHSEKKIHFIYL